MITARRAATPPQLKERGVVLDESSLWKDRASRGGLTACRMETGSALTRQRWLRHFPKGVHSSG